MISETVREGDFGYDLEFTLKNEDGSAFNLTGVTRAVLKVVTVGRFRNVINSDAVIEGPATDGKIKYTVLKGDFAKPGNRKAGITLFFGTTKIVTTNEFFLAVDKSLGPNA